MQTGPNALFDSINDSSIVLFHKLFNTTVENVGAADSKFNSDPIQCALTASTHGVRLATEICFVEIRYGR